jgi:hypothetical protein
MQPYGGKYPKNLDDAITLIAATLPVTEVAKIANLSEREFMSMTHHGLGQHLRNSWLLWWYPENSILNWPQTCPDIVKFFNEKGIYHGDDISSIILTSFYRKFQNRDIDLDGQVRYFIDYWKKEGFPDGNPMKERVTSKST